MKTILITGSSSGLGRLTAETLANTGHTVYASMRDPEGKNRTAADDLRALASTNNWQLTVLALDVTDETSVYDALAHIKAQSGTLDVVVNNAGLAAIGFNESFTAEQMQAMFDVNVFGVQRVNRAALPLMHNAGGGLLLHIASVVGRIVVPYMGVYAASKAALDILAESYRYDLAPLGIDSVIVEPGTHPTPLFDNFMPPTDTDRLSQYGGMADVPRYMMNGYRQRVENNTKLNPQDVADAVLRLIETPAEKRPLRTTIGQPSEVGGVNAINQTSAQVQQTMFDHMQMGHLLSVQAESTEA